MCSSCSCLLGTNQQCYTCDQAPLPDSFQQKIDIPVYDYWCPGIDQGQRCNNLLGKGNFPLRLFHLHFIKNEKNFHQQILGSFEWTKILQIDQHLHQLELTEEESLKYYYKESSKSLPSRADLNASEGISSHTPIGRFSAFHRKPFLLCLELILQPQHQTQNCADYYCLHWWMLSSETSNSSQALHFIGYDCTYFTIATRIRHWTQTSQQQD